MKMVTASQALKMYELFNKHFKSSEDAKVLVAGIEEVIAEKFNNEMDRLASKSDIMKLETRMEQGFKDQLRWLIGLMVGLCSLALAVLKLT